MIETQPVRPDEVIEIINGDLIFADNQGEAAKRSANRLKVESGQHMRYPDDFKPARKVLPYNEIHGEEVKFKRAR